jgi:HEAT repeats
MPRLIWCMLTVGAFGTGLAVASLHYSSAPQVPAEPLAAVADWQRQVAVLQDQIRTQEAELTILRQQVQMLSEVSPVVEQAALPAPRLRWPKPQKSRAPAPAKMPEETAVPPPSAEAPSAPTEQAALSRLRQYLEETEGMGPQERRGRGRALVDELRAMGEPAVTVLLQTLETGDNSRERRTAATLLGALQDVRALPALQEVLERDQDLMMRRAAANGLRLLQMPETIPVFSTMLADKQDDRFVRMSAAYGLAQLGEAQGVTGLMQIFDEAEQDGRGRFVAFRALTSLNDPAALPLMRQLAVSDADVSYRVAAMRFLANHGDKEALPLLQLVLNSPREQPSVLEAAAQSHAVITSGQPPQKPWR